MKIKCTRKFHHYVSSMKIKHRIVFKKRVASDCRTHKLFILTIFYIYIKMKYLFIIYNKQYIFVYCDIYLYYILYIYIFVYKTLPMHVFLHQSVCMCGECILVYLYPSVWVYIFYFQFYFCNQTISNCWTSNAKPKTLVWKDIQLKIY